MTKKNKALFVGYQKKKGYCASAMVSVAENKKTLKKFNKIICNFEQQSLL